MSARPRIFLIDGHALIYRAFFAMIQRPLRTSRGENTSAAWGVANFLLRLFDEWKPEYLAWTLDKGDSFRHREFPDYKATREKLDEALQQDFNRSMERIERLLEAWHVPVVALEGYEADDVIGTLAARAVAHGLEAVVVSGDKDFYQLIGPHVVLLNPGRRGPGAIDEQWIDATNAAERLGVPPGRVVDYLALVGDSSDNVPGVRGIGDKTARQLLAEFGDLEGLLNRLDEVEPKRAREALRHDALAARLSRRLVTIRRDLPLGLELERLAARPPDRQALLKLLSELEFHSLIPRIAAVEAPVSPAGEADLVDDPRRLEGVVAEIRRVPLVAMSVEVSPDEADGGEPVGVSLAVSPEHAWYFPFSHRSGEGLLAGEAMQRNLPPFGDPAMRPLVELLRDAAVPKAGHDVKRSWLALRRAGVELAGVHYDSQLAGFLVDPGRRAYELEALALDRLGRTLTPYEALVGAGKAMRPLAETSVVAAARYSAERSTTVLALQRAFERELEEYRLARLLDEIEMPLVGVLVDMEWRGIRVDTAWLHQLGLQFRAELEQLEQRIHAAAGTDFNINSTPQLRHVLFEKLMLPVVKRTKTGPSTDAGVLEQLAAMSYEVPQLLLEYRELTKLVSTYVDVLPSRVHPGTGRVHTSFNQVGAATGRLSSSEPNLQNIPVRTRRGELIRRAFVPGDGCVLLVADYSQIELRLLAHLSGDPAFVEAFARGGDIHCETASVIFGVPPGHVTAEMRARAKTINFATIYGQGPFALARQLGITQDDARQFIRQYFERFAGVRAWLDRTVAEAKVRGYVETIFGRRRYIPELRDPNPNIRAFGERTATNSPLQGSAADLIKRAMIGIHRAVAGPEPAAWLLLQVHDELVLEVRAEAVGPVRQVVQDHMEGAAELRVPLVVTIGVATNWLDAKS